MPRPEAGSAHQPLPGVPWRLPGKGTSVLVGAILSSMRLVFRVGSFCVVLPCSCCPIYLDKKVLVGAILFGGLPGWQVCVYRSLLVLPNITRVRHGMLVFLGDRCDAKAPQSCARTRCSLTQKRQPRGLYRQRSLFLSGVQYHLLITRRGCVSFTRRSLGRVART